MSVIGGVPLEGDEVLFVVPCIGLFGWSRMTIFNCKTWDAGEILFLIKLRSIFRWQLVREMKWWMTLDGGWNLRSLVVGEWPLILDVELSGQIPIPMNSN